MDSPFETKKNVVEYKAFDLLIDWTKDYDNKMIEV